MNPRDIKFRSIYEYLYGLWVPNQRTITFSDFVAWLNSMGFRNNVGQPYATPIGVGRLLSCVYAYVENEMGLGQVGATPVAMAVTSYDGTRPWDK